MNYKILFLFFSLSINPISANVETHLKKIVGKSGNHKIKNIDFIYMINLDKRPEKFARCKEQLSKYNIEPFRFSAVNGWELPMETINDVGVKYETWMAKDLWGTYYSPDKGEFQHEIMNVKGRTYFCHCTVRGPIGINLSHLSILKDALDSKYNTIWVMEDDIQIIKDPHKISSLIDKLDNLVGKKGWDILFTDKDAKDRNGNYVVCLSYAKRPNFSPLHPERFAVRKQIDSDFIKIGARYGAHSMIIRKSGIQKLLKFFCKYSLFLPYDMDFTMPDDIHLYTVTDDIVSNQPGALSDNGSPGYLKKEK